jgi:hypothetical protein
VSDLASGIIVILLVQAIQVYSSGVLAVFLPFGGLIPITRGDRRIFTISVGGRKTSAPVSIAIDNDWGED